MMANRGMVAPYHESTIMRDIVIQHSAFLAMLPIYGLRIWIFSLPQLGPPKKHPRGTLGKKCAVDYSEVIPFKQISRVSNNASFLYVTK